MNSLKQNASILDPEVQGFIKKHLDSDVSKLLFKGSPFEKVTIQELVAQIEAKKRSKKKLPTWFKTKDIYYSNKLNIEQTSSETAALYKSNLISGNTIIDLTGGFGVDAFYFSKRFKTVTHCEIHTDLSETVKHNYHVLKISNIHTKAVDGFAYLKLHKEPFDWIYIDPSRRNELKGKVFLLADCLPNVPENLEILFEHTNNVLIKTSPMLDITSAINELNHVKEVHVVAIENEVKELLFVLEKSYASKISIKTINITSGVNQHFDAIYKELTSAEFSLPKTYLYEPNAAILKAGLFDQLAKLPISKLQQNSHLYTSNELIGFPGRRFKIQHCIPYNKKELSTLIPSKKANITTRNFPETVVQIRKKTKLKDGGDDYLFFTTNIDNKYIVIICTKV